jgi:hypothetical protein
MIGIMPSILAVSNAGGLISAVRGKCHALAHGTAQPVQRIIAAKEIESEDPKVKDRGG